MNASFPPRTPRRCGTVSTPRCGTVSRPCHNGTRIGLGIVAVLLVSVAVGGCHRPPPAKMSKVPEVIVTTPITDDVTDYRDFTGRMDALKTVDIRPRVSGYITEAPFVEGDIVKEGDLLFQIDPRPYQAEVNQAKANLKLAEADVVYQTRHLDRDRYLLNTNTGAINAEAVDQDVAARDKAVASVAAMKAALEKAELNLGFTHVTAPPLLDDEGRRLVGRVSRRMADPGNLVNADQTILTTLVSIDPMYAYFDVDERAYLELAKKLNESGAYSGFSTLQFPVLMQLANENEFQTKGYVNFLDNRFNANTGTVRMRGLFANPSDVLKPGLFVRIRLPIGVPYMALLIPATAIQSDQGRKYVFVVKKDKNDKGEEVDKVEYRSVQVGQELQGLCVIKEGLHEGERVIVAGMQRVRAGAVVQAKMQQPPPPPKSRLTQILKEDQKTKATDPKPSVVVPSLKDMPRVPSKGARHGGKGRR